MRVVLSGAVGAALTGCSSRPGGSGGPSTAPVLEGTYVPADATTKSELSRLTLNGDGTYSSVQPGCQTSARRSHGTFTFDGASALTLADARTHAKTTMTVGALAFDDVAPGAAAVGALVSGGGGALVTNGTSGGGGASSAIVHRATLDGVAMKRQERGEAAAPRIFLSPNADITEGAQDWQTPFDHPGQWPTTLAAGRVIQLYESDIAPVLAATPFFVSMMSRRQLQLSIEASPLMSDACDDAGYPADGTIDARERSIARYTATLMNADFQPIYDAGGSITYAALDSEGIEPVVSADPSLHCHLTVEQAAQAQVYFLADMAATHPEIQFGLIANFPNYNYIDTTCYWNDAALCDQPFPGRDYADVLDTQISIIEGGGQSIYFVHVDNPYNYLFAHPTIDDVMSERILPLRDQVVSRGLRFGLIFNSEIVGSDGAAADQRFHDQTVADATYAATNGLDSEDDVIVESWFDYPSSILPETSPATFATTANDAIAAFLTAGGS